MIRCRHRILLILVLIPSLCVSAPVSHYPDLTVALEKNRVGVHNRLLNQSNLRPGLTPGAYTNSKSNPSSQPANGDNANQNASSAQVSAPMGVPTRPISLTNTDNPTSSDAAINPVAPNLSNSGANGQQGYALPPPSAPPPQSDGNGNLDETVPKDPPPNLVNKRFWIPLCFFFDPNYSGDYGRQTIRTVVKAFAQCDIAVQVHATTLAEGTFRRDDPNNLNANAQAHCNYKAFYQNASVKGAAQTHPDSVIASDIMCGQDPYDPTKVGGCAGGKVSIVDKNGGGSTATHEFGHNVGEPGLGGDKLVNVGEGTGSDAGGFGLQLQSVRYQGIEPPNGGGGGAEGTGVRDGKFNAAGCASLQAGANDNTRTQYKYDSNAFYSYYKKMGRPNRLNFDGRDRLFLPTNPVAGKAPPASGGSSRFTDATGRRTGSSNPISADSNTGTQGSGAGPTGGHKKKVATVPTTIKSPAQIENGTSSASAPGSTGSPPATTGDTLAANLTPVTIEGGTPGIRKTFGYDDSATTGNGRSSPNMTDPNTFFASEAGDGPSFGYNESLTKGSISTTSSTSSNGSAYASTDNAEGSSSGDANVFSLRNPKPGLRTKRGRLPASQLSTDFFAKKQEQRRTGSWRRKGSSSSTRASRQSSADSQP